MKIVLSIDTSNNKKVKVGLKINQEAFVIEQEIDTRKAQVTLPLIEKILVDHSLQLKDITKIQVSPGPGSFTGLRVGISIANTLGYILKIPVNGKEMVEPVYS
jgi:tRNA threonylcarbamoyladenosine biosynthesis protein TsaB